jgi:hypothetical protein
LLGDCDDLASVTPDTEGNLFVADDGDHRVRTVEARSGIITTVSDNGRAGFGGDSGAGHADSAEPAL